MRQRRVVSVVVAAVVVAFLTGCTSLVLNFNVSLDPESQTIMQGAQGEVTVTITHLIPVNVVPMPITVEIHDPPSYLTADELEIPAGITSDELHFSIAQDAPIGTVTIEVRASNGMTTKELSFELTISAAP
ncbi:MAG TPA: hypothetical protein VFN03_10580 [Trueperaceae bacterium]|nr:hypothetical protein [Trueperaceae bacterium]